MTDPALEIKGEKKHRLALALLELTKQEAGLDQDVVEAALWQALVTFCAIRHHVDREDPEVARREFRRTAAQAADLVREHIHALRRRDA